MANAPCSYCGSTAGPDHPCPGRLLGRILDDRYQIEGVLGQGGMGTVFRATQVTVRRPVAVKMLHPSLAAAPQFFERFRREAEVASRLNHPNIITVFDFGRTGDGICYFVMELVNGESLKQLVKREGPLPLRQAVGIITQAARGLGHAHHESVVHRDVKPHNLLISQVDGHDFVKILDFGLVKALELEEEEQLTSTGQVLGTPQYMPPEQAGGETVDARSDLYSLAGVLYYCLTGSSPYGANTVRKALTAALTQPLPPVNSKRQGAPVPRALDEFLRKALASDKEKRPQSAEDFLADLQASLAGLSDEELDALPTRPEGPRESTVEQRPGGGTPVSAARSKAPSRSPNVLVGHAGLTISRPRATAPEVPSLRSPGIAIEPRSGVGQWIVVSLAAIALFAIGGAVVVGVRRTEGAETPPGDQPTAPAPAPAPKPGTPGPPGAATAQPSPTVLVKLHSDPDGAEVFEGDERRGVTPLELHLGRGEVHDLTFLREGYMPVNERVDLGRYTGNIKNVDVSLQPLPKPARSVTGGKPTKPRKHEEIPVFE